MKKEILILAMLLLGISGPSFAGTGDANDGLVFSLIIVGMLLAIVALITTTKWLKNNGQLIWQNTITSFWKLIRMMIDYLGKLFTETDFHGIDQTEQINNR